MKNQLLVTLVGEDRPGIVARLTEVFVKHGANLEESRMAVLGKEFAAIILITVPESQQEGLKRDLNSLKEDALAVTTKSTDAIDPARFAGYQQLKISVNGADHEGIVHKVSRFLKDHGINIQTMDTNVVHAPETGTPLFQMNAVVLAPKSISQAELQKSLNSIGREENVEIGVSVCSEEDSRLIALGKSHSK